MGALAHADSLVGQIVASRYRVTKLLGTGGMAAVYQAAEQSGPYDVAIKILDAKLARDPNVARRFRHEAKTAARIQHPNAVRILDYGIDGPHVYIVMEYLEGRDLSSILATQAPLELSRAIDLMAQICDVLSAAHRDGILHRDLKPENVMVLGIPPAEHIKVLDFGLAKVFERVHGSGEEDTALTSQGSVVGTPEYMSPEQCRRDKLDQRSDVYACGVLLYQMLTARVPFHGETPLDTMLLHVKKTPASPCSIVASIPSALEGAVLKAMAKQPSHRYQTARHFQEALIKLAFDSGFRSEPPGPRSRPPSAAPEMAPVPRTSMPSIDEEAAHFAMDLRLTPAMTASPAPQTPPPNTHAAPVPANFAPPHAAAVPHPSPAARSRRTLLIAVAGVIALLAILIAVVLVLIGHRHP